MSHALAHELPERPERLRFSLAPKAIAGVAVAVGLAAFLYAHLAGTRRSPGAPSTPACSAA